MPTKSDIVRTKIIEAMLGIYDAELAQFAASVAKMSRGRSASQWAAEMETLGRLDVLSREGRAALIDMASGPRSGTE